MTKRQFLVCNPYNSLINYNEHKYTLLEDGLHCGWEVQNFDPKLESEDFGINTRVITSELNLNSTDREVERSIRALYPAALWIGPWEGPR